MKLFISKAIGLLVLLILFNGILYRFADKYYYQGYKTDPPKKFSTFLFADSHGLAIEDNAEKYGIYNFSADSESYFDMYRKLQYLIKREYSIDTVYITVDNHTLSPYRKSINNLNRSSAYILPDGNEAGIRHTLRTLSDVYLPIVKSEIRYLFRSYLFNGLKNQLKKLKGNSVGKVPKQWVDFNEQEQRLLALKRVEKQFPTEEENPDLRKELQKIIELCQKEDIDLIGLKFPVTELYSEISKDKNYGADSLFRSYHLPVVQCTNTVPEEDIFYKDQDHLNVKGGMLFIEHCLKPLSNGSFD